MIKSLIEEKLSQNEIEIPLLPEVAGKVVRLTQDPESDASSLAKLIQSDQTLASQVMRVANSAAYSPNSNLVSLQQAISRLGIRLISDIAMAASINASLFDAPGFESHIRSQIHFALATALWSKEVARCARHNVEAAFLAGLLHNIGRPAALQTIIKTTKHVKQDLSKEALLKLEKHFQQAFGLRLVEMWNMPAPVGNAIRYFNNHTSPHNTILHTRLIVAGANFARHLNYDDDPENAMSLEELKSQPVLGELDLYQDDIESLLEKRDQVHSTMETMSK